MKKKCVVALIAILIMAVLTGCGTAKQPDITETAVVEVDEGESTESNTNTDVASDTKDSQLADSGNAVEDSGNAAVDSENVVEDASEDDTNLQELLAQNTYVRTPFYGIWIFASKNLMDAEQYREELKENGLDVQILLSSDWTGLNSEKWYVVTSGMYDTEQEAKDKLPEVQKYYKEAYVKYSGDFRGSDTTRMDLYVFSNDRINVYDNYVTINSEATGFDAGSILVIDDKTVFDENCEMTFFENYTEGMSVVDWYKTNKKLIDEGEVTLTLMGVFDIEVQNNHINKIYGSYWWD